MIDVLVVDDHIVVRTGLKQILAETPEIRVSGEAGTGNTALDLFRQKEWDVVVLDLSLPDLHGLDVLKAMRAERPACRILVLTMHDENQYAIRALKAGAWGFLTKESAPDQLVSAVKRVASGQRFITPSVAEALAYSFTMGDEGPSHESLSDREFQVLSMIGSGKTPRQIAEELCLSIKTINTYRARLLEKMSMKTTSELIHYALRNHLIQ